MPPSIPWVRGILFTLLVPVVLAVLVPARILGQNSAKGGLWQTGWFLVAAGGLVYAVCLYAFLLAGGTPAIFFTRPLRFVLGEEPALVVQRGLYRFSRNPMYLGVVLTILGQAVLFGSRSLAWYAASCLLCFHVVVVFLEEPHLREVRGASYIEYCQRVPRWLGWPKTPPA